MKAVSLTVGGSIALFLLLSEALFGCASEDAEADPPCDACITGRRQCTVTQGESFAVDVTDPTSTGCKVVRVSPGMGEWTVHCNPLEICNSTTCTPLDGDDTWRWGDFTCQPPK